MKPTSFAPRWTCRCGASNHPLRVKCEACGRELEMGEPADRNVQRPKPPVPSEPRPS